VAHVILVLISPDLSAFADADLRAASSNCWPVLARPATRLESGVHVIAASRCRDPQLPPS